MLKKLKIKFVLINMSIVTLILGLIFGFMYYSTCRNMEQESLRMMDNAFLAPGERPVPGSERTEDVRIPYFSVFMDREGKMTGLDGEFFDLTDQTNLDELLRETLDAPESRGELPEQGLRFEKREGPQGQHIIFADMTSEQSTLKHMIRTFLIVGCGAFLVFLAISILLAQWAVKPVEKAWQQQKQFVADASHELKTPLTVIATDAELIHAEDCPAEDVSRLSHSILLMTKQMRGLVEELLQLARVENESARKDFSPVCFSDMASTGAMQFEPLFFEKEIEFTYEVEPDITVNGLDTQLKQLVDILLDNALKYTASPLEGEPKAAVLSLKSISEKKCLLEVSSTGETMSEEQLEQIFKRFYRGDKARAMNQSYGLGLSIAESIVQNHKGRIRAESKEGINRFRAEIPVL
ncbi:MAG: HAMP domain-containing histidine kinase [Lachnospiraceae bacterium]|nr:HAMP domain-containing histidine kinase [Lachnospiraceae bacterium]